jgi:glycine/sarcosine/betaine reductase complex component C subunit beta
LTRAHLSFASQILAHVPDLVLSGSKPRREIALDPSLVDTIAASLRSAEEAARYLPNQIFLGAREPQPLADPKRPWWSTLSDECVWEGRSGVLFSQEEFLAALQAVDVTGLMSLREDRMATNGRPGGLLVESLKMDRNPPELLDPMPIPAANGSLGEIGWGYAGDEALAPSVLLDNLATKASGALALAHLLKANDIDPASLDFVVSCSEEAVGDRYQRGGGNMGKAIAEAVGAGRASGFDVKNFCAAPVPALVVAASLVETGVADRVAVVAGGCVAKLGMKFRGHLKSEMPVMEDCLGGIAVLVSAHDEGPTLRYDAVGRHNVEAGGANPIIFSQLVFEPLDRVGLKTTDVGLFGTELHNPELTEPQGSGDVPLRNYRMIAVMAAQAHHIEQAEIDDFLMTRCVAGYAPTQGHVASAICLLPHVLQQMRAGRLQRAQLVAKGSLFLGRMTAISDGMSVVIEP